MEAHEYVKMARLQDTHWWFDAKRRVAGAVLDRHATIASGQRVLEVGCGTGAMVPLLRRHGRVVGIDIYPDALRHVAGAAPVVGSALELPFAPASFGLVACFDLLYHRNVVDVEAALAELARVIVPGGLLLITDSACPALYGAHDRAHHGARRFSRPQMVELLAVAGLEPRHVSYFHTAVFPAVAVSRLGAAALRRLFGRSDPEAGASQLQPSPAPINATLKGLYRIEAALVGRFRLPLGVSLVALAQRPEPGASIGA